MADNKSRNEPANLPKTSGPTESNDSVGEAVPESSDLVTAPVEDKPLGAPVFGPGSKVNWDNEKADPNKRKHVGIDPDGKHNAKLLG